MNSEWTDEQFLLLLAHPDEPSEQLATLIERSSGAIVAVRAGLQYFLEGSDEQAQKFLSRSQREIIARLQRSLSVDKSR